MGLIRLTRKLVKEYRDHSGISFERQFLVNWKRAYFGGAAILYVASMLVYLLLAYDVTLSCRRADDLCEAIAQKPLWTAAERFRVSEVIRAYARSDKDRKGRRTGLVGVFDLAGGRQVEIPRLSDSKVMEDFQRFHKDPAASSFEGRTDSSAFGCVFAFVLAGMGTIPLLLGLHVRSRIRRLTKA